ncbi:T9SS type B sorting domain-containing protein [bacterium]|nr:T9SS type B sorting domain-containing protein [bacterium]
MKWFFPIFLMLLCAQALAQPANDNWKNAIEIEVKDNGFFVGSTRSVVSSMRDASVEKNEIFHRSVTVLGLDQKTVWYKFTIATTRQTEVVLRQRDTLIPARDAGFTVYNKTNHIPGKELIAYDLPTITQFGSSSNNCLQKGTYYIQVCSRSRVEDSLWIELHLAPSATAGNTIDKPVYANALNASFFNNPCLSISNKSELRPFSDSSFSKSVYLNFTSPSYISKANFSFTARKFAFWLYKGDISDSSTWQLLDSTSHFGKNSKTLTKYYSCGKTLNYSELYFIKILYRPDANMNFSGIIYNGLHRAVGQDPNSSQLNFGNTKTSPNVLTRTVTDYISCGTDGTQYVCINLNHLLLDTVDYSGTKAIIDTMTFGSWSNFSIAKNATFNFQSNYALYDSLGVHRSQSWLFKGYYNDPGFCKQKPTALYNHYKNCLAPGKYTIFTGTYGNMLSATDTIYNQQMGETVQYSYSLQSLEGDSGPPALYADPRYPVKIRGLLFNKNKETRTLPTDWLNSGDSTTTNIAGNKQSGYFSYYTFTLDRKGFVVLYRMAGNFNFHVYSGDCTRGTKNLKDNIDPYIAHYKRNDFYNMVSIPAGTYTIVCHRNVSTPCDPPVNPFASLQLKVAYNDGKIYKPDPPKPCTPQYCFAKNAGKINGGNALTHRNTDTFGYTAYTFTSGCRQNFSNRGNHHWYNRKAYISLPKDFYYYEFELAEKSSVYIQGDMYFQVLKGSISTDSTIAQHAENVLVEYANPRFRTCALPAGSYSIVVASSTDFWGQIQITRYHKPGNDFARQAVDLGILSQTNNGLQAKATYGCSFSSTATDLGYHPNNPPKNQWFTFRKAGNGSLKLLLTGGNPTYYLMQSKRGGGFDFKYLRQHQMVDSLYAQNLMLLKPETDGTYLINNNNKDTVRYYLLVAHSNAIIDFGLFQVQVNLLSNADPHFSTIGDSCSNAVLDSVTSANTKTIRQWVNGHSLGEGPFESYSAGLCSKNLSIENLKTSWFKVKINTAFGNRLTVSSGDPDVAEIKIYSGNCNALTQIGCLSGAATAISLDCVESGYYYIQVFTLKDLKKQIFISLKLNNAFNTCRINKDMGLLVNFTSTKNCKGENRKFINLSTFGPAIKYSWRFGDGDTSSGSNPSHYYGYDAPDSVWVTLAVYNSQNNKKDSLSKLIYLEIPTIKPLHDTTVCSSPCALNARQVGNKNYTYNWFMLSDSADKKAKYPVARNSNSASFYVNKPYSTALLKVSNPYCHLFDTVQIESVAAIVYDLNPKSNFRICPNAPVSIHFNKPNGLSFRWYDGDTASTKEFNKGGLYKVNVIDSTCSFGFTYQVQQSFKPQYKLPDSLCYGSEISLFDTINFPPFRLMSINNKLPNIGITDSQLIMHWEMHSTDSCALTDTAVIPHFIKLHKSLNDTGLCANGSVQLNARNQGANYLWSNGDTTQKTIINRAGKYLLFINKGACTLADTVYVSSINYNSGLPVDTSVCLNSLAPNLRLQAQNADSVWWSNGSRGPIAYTGDSGYIYMQAMLKNCLFKDSVLVLNQCEPQLFVPNAFSPNGDAVNPTFLAKGTHIEDFEMWIFARNGQVVYYSTDIAYGWDGMVNGEPAALGSYLYLINYEINGISRTKSGYLHLLK